MPDARDDAPLRARRKERELFLDSLGGAQPQIVVQTDRSDSCGEKSWGNRKITYVKHADSLEAIHETFVVAASLANPQPGTSTKFHS